MEEPKRRTIELSIHPECTLDQNSIVLQSAIAYLSMWAIHNPNYCKLDLSFDKNAEGTAVYKNDEKVTYVIGAIYHEETNRYSFHS